MTECLPDLPRYVRKRGGSWQGADHQNGPWRSIPAPQQALPWRTDGPAAPESREPASVAPEATRPRLLSPAAQAVLDAFLSEWDVYAVDDARNAIAAALRAVADQAVPDEGDKWTRDMRGDAWTRWDERKLTRRKLLAIAAELEGEAGEIADHILAELQGFHPRHRVLGELTAGRLTRAAALLEQLSAVAPAVVPVPVSERPWEREGWCDAEGRCWWGRIADEFCNPDWHYATWEEVQEFCSDAMPQVSLSHYAIPMAAAQGGEVEG